VFMQQMLEQYGRPRARSPSGETVREPTHWDKADYAWACGDHSDGRNVARRPTRVNQPLELETGDDVGIARVAILVQCGRVVHVEAVATIMAPTFKSRI